MRNEKMIKQETVGLLRELSKGVEIGVFQVCSVKVAGIVSVAIRDLVTECYVAVFPAYPKEKEIDKIINTNEFEK